MRSRLIGLMTMLLISSLPSIWPVAALSDPVPSKTSIAPLPTKTLFVTTWPTKTPFVIEPPTETAHPIDRPTKTPFPAMTEIQSPSATGLPMSTVESTQRPMPTERPTKPPHASEPPSATSVTALPVDQPLSTRPVVSNPSPTADRSSPSPEPTNTTELKAVDHTSDDHSTTAAPVVIAPITVDLARVVIAVVGLGLSVWVGLWQHRRALVHSYTAWARADLRLRSETERLAHHDHRVVDEAWTIRLLNQTGLAATGETLGIDQIDRVMLEPIPAIVGLGHHFERVVFTPAPPAAIIRLIKRRALIDLFGDSLHGVRPYSIDALNGALFVTDDLAAAWEYLCDRLLSSPITMPLPRTDRWSITIVPSQSARRAAGALYRIFTGRR